MHRYENKDMKVWFDKHGQIKADQSGRTNNLRIGGAVGVEYYYIIYVYIITYILLYYLCIYYYVYIIILFMYILLYIIIMKLLLCII